MGKCVHDQTGTHNEIANINGVQQLTLVFDGQQRLTLSVESELRNERYIGYQYLLFEESHSSCATSIAEFLLRQLRNS